MIERSRMKTDLAVQTVLMLAAIFTGLSGLSPAWPVVLLAGLGIWQGASALQLALAYEYQERYPFLWLFFGLLLALPFSIWLLGAWSVFPVALGVSAYFIITVRDTVYVLQRPRSFWDL